jgi:hypothetical protein
LKCLFLREWLAAGYLDEFASERCNLVHDVVDGVVLAARERVFAVAPDTTHRAARQTHEGTGPSGVR